MNAFPPLDEQLALLLRGAESVYTKDELRTRLAAAAASGKPLRVKLGLDPTAPDIHLGHTVVLQKMRQFQDCGHKAVMIIGDFTARIGDPTGKSKTRPILGEAEIRANAETYFKQAGKVLDTHPAKLEIRYNSEWLAGLNLAEILRLQSHMSVAQMLQRENFKLRMEKEQEIVLTELMYPLMQGYDSVAIDSDIELGGTDQTFNNLVGRDLMPHYGKPKQLVMVMPILRGLDGHEKMSKSLGNYIGVTENAKDMFGKTMSIADSLMAEWYTLLTDLPAEEIRTLTDGNQTHPRDAKIRLAKYLVTRFHSAATAEQELEMWQKVMVEGGLREDIPTVTLPADAIGPDGTIAVPALIKALGLAPSTSEARRLIQGGGVLVDQEKVTDPNAKVAVREGMLVQVGKRKAVKIAKT